MIVKEFKLGSTTIEIDNTYFPATYEENQKVYEEFNKIGCEILRNLNKWNGREKQMKNIIRGIIFWTIAIAFILIMFGLAELLTKIVTMNFIMAVVYIALGFSFIYLLRN